MKGYILKRFFHSIFVLVGISLVVFIILHLTGDPAALLMPMDATPEQVAQFRKEMGFEDPLIVQYWRFSRGLYGETSANLSATASPLWIWSWSECRPPSS
jgi:ABC-type dipeptide/oligopeptide/nickel transport system permease component